MSTESDWELAIKHVREMLRRRGYAVAKNAMEGHRREDVVLIRFSHTGTVDAVREFSQDVEDYGDSALGILVTVNPLTPQAHNATHGRVQAFTVMEMLLDPWQSAYFFPHDVVSPSLLGNDAHKIPLLRADDFAARYFGLAPGQIVKITRQCPVAGVDVAFRRVVPRLDS